ncbi:DhNV_078 [Dikerogammarus haemobaphes nudivirus]|nr:DhNV_078 [Dikerogammarus haemobaphes nudivirus]
MAEGYNNSDYAFYKPSNADVMIEPQYGMPTMGDPTAPINAQINGNGYYRICINNKDKKRRVKSKIRVSGEDIGTYVIQPSKGKNIKHGPHDYAPFVAYQKTHPQATHNPEYNKVNVSLQLEKTRADYELYKQFEDLKLTTNKPPGAVKPKKYNRNITIPPTPTVEQIPSPFPSSKKVANLEIPKAYYPSSLYPQANNNDIQQQQTTPVKPKRTLNKEKKSKQIHLDLNPPVAEFYDSRILKHDDKYTLKEYQIDDFPVFNHEDYYNFSLTYNNFGHFNPEVDKSIQNYKYY